MNYVGCKELHVRRIRHVWSRFYMNYVGCKGMYETTLYNILARFIWTMWDVKTSYGHSFAPVGFVLYELCGM